MTKHYCVCGQPLIHRRYEPKYGCVIIYVGCTSLASLCSQSLLLATPLPSELPPDWPVTLEEWVQTSDDGEVFWQPFA